MDVTELRGKTLDELQAAVIELRKNQFKLRLQKGTGQLSQTHLLKQTRADIARVKTVMGEKKGQ